MEIMLLYIFFILFFGQIHFFKRLFCFAFSFIKKDVFLKEKSVNNSQSYSGQRAMAVVANTWYQHSSDRDMRTNKWISFIETSE